MFDKFVVSIILVISIVIQSFTAIAAPSNDHQLDIQHIQSEHNHSDDLQLNNSSVIQQEHNISDCHHCGHCTGTHLSWILVKSVITPISAVNIQFIPYQNSAYSEVFEASFRPPRS